MSSTKLQHILVALMFLAAGTPAGAQAVKGSLIGSITDSSGAAVPAASIEITEVQTGITRAAVTNQSGAYSVPNLPAGLYRGSYKSQVACFSSLKNGWRDGTAGRQGSGGCVPKFREANCEVFVTPMQSLTTPAVGATFWPCREENTRTKNSDWRSE